MLLTHHTPLLARCTPPTHRRACRQLPRYCIVRASANNGSSVNVLVVGGGGREHALAWKLSQSPQCNMLYCTPGNPGIAAEPGITTLPAMDVGNHASVVDFCKTNDIQLVVVGPEAPLVDGLADSLAAASINVFGPSASAARLEGSKAFMKVGGFDCKLYSDDRNPMHCRRATFQTCESNCPTRTGSVCQVQHPHRCVWTLYRGGCCTCVCASTGGAHCGQDGWLGSRQGCHCGHHTGGSRGCSQGHACGPGTC